MMFTDFHIITLLAAFKVEPVLTVLTVLFLIVVPALNTFLSYKALKANPNLNQHKYEITRYIFKFKSTKLISPVFSCFALVFIWTLSFILLSLALIFFLIGFYAAGFGTLIIFVAPKVIKFLVRKYFKEVEPYSQKEKNIVSGVLLLIIFGLFTTVITGLGNKIDTSINNLDSVKKGKIEENAYYSCINKKIIITNKKFPMKNKHVNKNCNDIKETEKLANYLINQIHDCAKGFSENKLIQIEDNVILLDYNRYYKNDFIPKLKQQHKCK